CLIGQNRYLLISTTREYRWLTSSRRLFENQLFQSVKSHMAVPIATMAIASFRVLSSSCCWSRQSLQLQTELSRLRFMVCLHQDRSETFDLFQNARYALTDELSVALFFLLQLAIAQVACLQAQHRFFSGQLSVLMKSSSECVLNRSLHTSSIGTSATWRFLTARFRPCSTIEANSSSISSFANRPCGKRVKTSVPFDPRYSPQ